MNPNDKILELAIDIFRIHMRTKTLCPVFHEKSAPAYEFGIEAWHKLTEKLEDLDVKTYPNDDLYDMKAQAYENVEEIKRKLEELVKQKNTVGQDNLIRSLIDQAEGICGNLRAFINEEDAD
jgi:hypothetical protein